jgi:glycosyltransferase involved in cell wall biosynthesis
MTRYNKFMPRICITPRVDGRGGMASFRLKFEDGLRARGIQITHDLSENAQAVLVIGGTRRLPALWKAGRRGARIVQRLDGINWVQRARRTGPRYHLRAEYGNALLALIRGRLADRVVYQSEFIRTWWEDWYGPARAPARVILNGVDLNQYSPVGRTGSPTYIPDGRAASPTHMPDGRNVIPTYPPYRILVVEGSLAGGLDTGLRAAARLTGMLAEKLPVELAVAGEVDPSTRAGLERESRAPVRFLGNVPREHIPDLDQSAHLLFSAEINPPCPNSVIEALACGLPVLGFDTGALRELVGQDAGRLIPYGGNPWKLDPPDVAALAGPAVEILQNQPRFRGAARARAESVFGIDRMVDEYLKVLLEE